MCDNCMVSEVSHENEGYTEFEQSVIESLEFYGDKPLFQTDAEGLFDLYLQNIPEASRQHYNCHACKEFIERYGGLVVITEHGSALPALWSASIPDFFLPAVVAISDRIGRANITGLFLSKEETFGKPVTGEWTHLHAKNPKPFQERLHKAGEVMAEKRADFGLLKRSLVEYPIDAVNQALNLLRTDALYRSEKVLGVAEWFREIHVAWANQPNKKLADNALWKAVAQAPPGYCHVKNTMIGTLLDDIIAGLSLEDVSRRFAAKMHPLQYQRPQAAPTAGNIARAEEIVEKLGIAPSLERRFARLEEVIPYAIWKPTNQEKQKKEGVFGHLQPKGASITKVLEAPEQHITFRKFCEEVLPNALTIDLLAPSKGDYIGILTAVHQDAPPILQWDQPDARNPFSVYLYTYGSFANRWNLGQGGWVQVNALVRRPHEWTTTTGLKHYKEGAIFILDGAKDLETQKVGNALFPENLKADLREIRSTIEAYSKQAKMQGVEEASACGIEFAGTNPVIVRVTNELGIATYKIDRWD